jgi:hypothetical protein
MQARPSGYKIFQVTAVVTNLVAVVLMVGFKGLIHKGLFGTIEALLLCAVASNLMAWRTRDRR